MALYNDRVYAYERMLAVDAVIDDDPSAHHIKTLLDADERHILAANELKSFNDTREFLYVHPITKMFKMESSLAALRRSDPSRFANELINADKSISRYRSMIKNKKYRDKQELEAWQDHMKKYNEKKEIMNRLLND